MGPEFPPEMPYDFDYIEIVGATHQAVECAMMRGVYRCNNETRFVLAYREPNTSRYGMLPMCELCQEEFFMTGPERRDYWKRFSQHQRGM